MAKKESSHSKRLEQLGNRIKQLRIDKGYSSYDKFAYANDIPMSQYWRYENGENMKFSSLLKILDAHEMSLKEFFSEGFD